MTTRFLLMLLPLSVWVLSACTGVHSFSQSVRAGDTVALATGYRDDLSRDTMTVTITPVSGFLGGGVETGPSVVYGPNDPNVIAVINLYPDPVSSLLVSREVGQDQTPGAQTYESSVEVLITGDNKDMWETMVYLNVPDSTPVGLAKVEITDGNGNTLPVIQLNVTGTGGNRHPFKTRLVGNLLPDMLYSMERAPNNPVVFGSPVVPYAIEVTLTHDPDEFNGGTGRPIAINPRGDIKTLAWSDDGTNMRVLMMPSGTQTRDHINDFRFYVAGGVNNVQIASLNAYDENGNAVPNTIGAVLPASPPTITSVVTSGGSVTVSGSSLCVLCPSGGTPTGSADSSVVVDNTAGSETVSLSFVSETQLIFPLPADGYTRVYVDTLGGADSFTP